MATEWLREADDYQCTLPSETQRVALEELREDNHTREEALSTMRDWIRKNPRIINCRLDANFLLRFLRTKKFSCPLAQDSLERYLLLRHVYAAGFQNLDMNLPNMKELIDNGYMFAVPERDHLGRRIIIGRPGAFDPYKHTNADMLRIHGITYETLMEDEMNQIHGYIHIGDGAGVGFHYLTLFTPKEAVRIVKNAERTLPMRHKEGHVFNVHPALKFAVDWGLTLISEKMQKRVKVYTSLDDAVKHLDPKLLPKEYGGVMPMEEMIRLWKKELEVHRDQLLSHDKMKVQIEMYNERVREGAVSALNMSLDYRDNSTNKDIVLAGLNGSFRKLEVD